MGMTEASHLTYTSSILLKEQYVKGFIVQTYDCQQRPVTNNLHDDEIKKNRKDVMDFSKRLILWNGIDQHI